MAQPIRQTEAPFDTEDDLQPHNIHHLQHSTEKHFRIITLVSMTISAIALLYVFSTIGLVKDGYNYREHIMTTEMLPFWKQLADEEEGKNGTAIIEEGEHKITRQELGHMGWTILHMVTGSFPAEITPELRLKFNTFLRLFGHMYPCKLCSQHFLKMQREIEPFSGSTKEELMIYLC